MYPQYAVKRVRMVMQRRAGPLISSCKHTGYGYFVSSFCEYKYEQPSSRDTVVARHLSFPSGPPSKCSVAKDAAIPYYVKLIHSTYLYYYQVVAGTLYSVLRLPVHTGTTPYVLSGGAVQLALSTLLTWNLPARNNLDLKSCSTPTHRQSSYSIATAAEPCDYTDITQLIHPIRQRSINFGQPRADTLPRTNYRARGQSKKFASCLRGRSTTTSTATTFTSRIP